MHGFDRMLMKSRAPIQIERTTIKIILIQDISCTIGTIGKSVGGKDRAEKLYRRIQDSGRGAQYEFQEWQYGAKENHCTLLNSRN